MRKRKLCIIHVHAICIDLNVLILSPEMSCWQIIPEVQQLPVCHQLLGHPKINIITKHWVTIYLTITQWAWGFYPLIVHNTNIVTEWFIPPPPLKTKNHFYFRNLTKMWNWNHLQILISPWCCPSIVGRPLCRLCIHLKVCQWLMLITANSTYQNTEPGKMFILI